MKTELHELAKTLLDVVPLVMRSIRAEMRAHRNAELSVPQFRVLGYVKMRAGVSLSAVAEHMGLTPASMSAMVEALVARGLVLRTTDSTDRRRVVIEITHDGDEAWTAAWEATCTSMVNRMKELDAAQRRELTGGLQALRLLFAGVGDGAPASGPR